MDMISGLRYAAKLKAEAEAAEARAAAADEDGEAPTSDEAAKPDAGESTKPR